MQVHGLVSMLVEHVREGLCVCSRFRAKWSLLSCRCWRLEGKNPERRVTRKLSTCCVSRQPHGRFEAARECQSCCYAWECVCMCVCVCVCVSVLVGVRTSMYTESQRITQIQSIREYMIMWHDCELYVCVYAHVSLSCLVFVFANWGKDRDVNTRLRGQRWEWPRDKSGAEGEGGRVQQRFYTSYTAAQEIGHSGKTKMAGSEFSWALFRFTSQAFGYRHPVYMYIKLAKNQKGLWCYIKSVIMSWSNTLTAALYL